MTTSPTAADQHQTPNLNPNPNQTPDVWRDQLAPAITLSAILAIVVTLCALAVMASGAR